MASILTGAARVAHSAVANVLAASQISVGDEMPALNLKEDDPEKCVTLDLRGKNIIVRACTISRDESTSIVPIALYSSVFPARSRPLAVLRYPSISRIMTSTRRKGSKTSTSSLSMMPL